MENGGFVTEQLTRTFGPAGFAFLGGGFLLLIIWSLAWKGLALWKAARAGSKPWFIALLIVNTVGILEILYLYVFSGSKRSVPEAPLPPPGSPS